MSETSSTGNASVAFGGMALAMSVVIGIFYTASQLADSPATVTQRTNGAPGVQAPVFQRPQFIVNAEFNAIEGWTARELAEALCGPLGMLGIDVIYRPDLNDGGGLAGWGSYDFGLLVTRTVDGVIGARPRPHAALPSSAPSPDSSTHHAAVMTLED